MKKLLVVAMISAFSLGTLAFAEESANTNAAPAVVTTETKTEVKAEKKTEAKSAAVAHAKKHKKKNNK
jgi:hypothetical protein